MTDIASTNSGTTPVRESHRFDEARIAAWMAIHVEGYEGPLTVEQFRGGQSNPTYKLITPGRSYVLRRKPPGVVVKGAHAVDREARVLTALGGCGYPVARVYAQCSDETVIGTWFYIMEMVEGRIFWDASLANIPKPQRAAYYDAMNSAIAALHKVDYRAAGLEDFGRPGNYFQRQIERWSKQYLADAEAGRDDNLDRLIEWLPRHVPAGDEITLVHGDFRIDNMIFHPTEPRILAVLDWELSTLGHPLADFANHLMMYDMPPQIVAGIGGMDPSSHGLPTRDAYIADYCRRVGRDAIPDIDFYIAFGFFRLAAIFHGIKGRVIRGTAANAHAAERAGNLPLLAEIAWRQTRNVMTRT